MEAKEFAQLADWLQNEPNISEAHYRTVVGRWYYSAFHEVGGWLSTRFAETFELADGNTHIRLTNCCNELQRKHMDLQLSKLGRLIKEFHARRVRADYYIDRPAIPDDMEEAKLNYEEIIELLDLLKDKYAEND